MVLHLVAPLRLFSTSWICHALGWPLIVAGLLTFVWAVWAIEDIDIGLPTKIISTGPHAFRRNPMYVAWTLISLGLSLAANTLWPVVSLPGALIYTHVFVVLREERALERRFGDEYRRYRAKVSRYL
jgi:protein-S-isoprenylcysteine O-methyltransferase Ste14